MENMPISEVAKTCSTSTKDRLKCRTVLGREGEVKQEVLLDLLV